MGEEKDDTGMEFLRQNIQKKSTTKHLEEKPSCFSQPSQLLYIVLVQIWFDFQGVGVWCCFVVGGREVRRWRYVGVFVMFVCVRCVSVCVVCVCSVWVRKGEDENEKNIHVAAAHMDGVCTLTYDSSVTPTAGTCKD